MKRVELVCEMCDCIYNRTYPEPDTCGALEPVIVIHNYTHGAELECLSFSKRDIENELQTSS